MDGCMGRDRLPSSSLTKPTAKSTAPRFGCCTSNYRMVPGLIVPYVFRSWMVWRAFTMTLNRVICFASLIGLLWGMGHAPQASEPGQRSVIDMAGRTVQLPEAINRVVTLGSLPVLNSFVFTMGEGRTLINGLADFGLSPHWKYQFVFAPHLVHLPTMQQPNRDPNVEAILLARPDVVLTMHRASVDLLESNTIPTIFLAWREPEDVKACMT